MICSLSQRITDTLTALDREHDCWVAAGRKDGAAHSIPLSYCRDGEQLVVATRRESGAENAPKRTCKLRFSPLSTHDVVIIDATATIVTLNEIDAEFPQLFGMVA